jgi:pimeloyl-ACP methyl ester carboxylesterase
MSPTPEAVQPLWLIKALAAIFLAAVLCAYLTLCLLFYQGQWQLVLHPGREASVAPPVVDSPSKAELVRFAPDESATPQLTGWWIPAAPGARYAHATLLFLPGADGRLADSFERLSALHNLGLNILSFDYRGYGASAPLHPTQKNMADDAESAWQYLRTSRNIAEEQIVPYGTGVGASLAAHLAQSHPQTPAIILESPRGDLLDIVRSDPRSKLIPLGLLFHDRFDLAAPLAAIKTPKLFLIADNAAKVSVPKDGQVNAASDAAAEGVVNGAASPKVSVHLHTADFNGPVFREQLSRFLDEFLPPTAPLLTPATPAVAK